MSAIVFSVQNFTSFIKFVPKYSIVFDAIGIGIDALFFQIVHC